MIPFPSKPFHLFVDVGLSYSAPHSQMILKQNADAFVIGIEPNPRSCSNVKKVLGDCDRFHLIEAGVGDSAGQLELNIVGPDEGCSSFLDITNTFKQKGYKVLDQVTVPVVTLQSILDQVPWDRVQTGLFDMKSDTQGYEDKVILGLGKYIERLATLQIETQTWGYYEQASDHNVVKSLLDKYLYEIRNEGENAWFEKK